MIQRCVAHETFIIEKTYDVSAARTFEACAAPVLKARWFSGSFDVLGLVARLSLAVRPYFGLIERLFYVATIAWIVTTCWACAFLHGW